MNSTFDADVRPTVRTPASCSRKAAPYAVLLEADDSATVFAPPVPPSSSASASTNDVKNSGRYSTCRSSRSAS